jgi:hypothetical protein
MTITINTYLADYDLLPSLQFVANDYLFMRDETLDALDITTESESNNKALKAVAKVKYWERVVAKTSSDFDYKTEGESYSRYQVWEMACKNLAGAVSDAMPYLPNYEIQVGTFTYSPNPYDYDVDRESL